MYTAVENPKNIAIFFAYYVLYSYINEVNLTENHMFIMQCFFEIACSDLQRMPLAERAILIQRVAVHG